MKLTQGSDLVIHEICRRLERKATKCFYCCLLSVWLSHFGGIHSCCFSLLLLPCGLWSNVPSQFNNPPFARYPQCYVPLKHGLLQEKRHSFLLRYPQCWRCTSLWTRSYFMSWNSLWVALWACVWLWVWFWLGWLCSFYSSFKSKSSCPTMWVFLQLCGTGQLPTTHSWKSKPIHVCIYVAHLFRWIEYSVKAQVILITAVCIDNGSHPHFKVCKQYV